MIYDKANIQWSYEWFAFSFDSLSTKNLLKSVHHFVPFIRYQFQWNETYWQKTSSSIASFCAIESSIQLHNWEWWRKKQRAILMRLNRCTFSAFGYHNIDLSHRNYVFTIWDPHFFSNILSLHSRNNRMNFWLIFFTSTRCNIFSCKVFSGSTVEYLSESSASFSAQTVETLYFGFVCVSFNFCYESAS